MKRLLQISLVILLLVTVGLIDANAQRRAKRTSSARAAYGEPAWSSKTNTKRTKKTNQKARKEAKLERARNNKQTYWSGRPY